jgi:hypothetical protein
LTAAQGESRLWAHAAHPWRLSETATAAGGRVNHQHVAGPDWITTLITVGAPTVTAVGVVGLGARYATRREERQARQGAYAGLVTAASTLLRDHRQLRTAYALNRSGDPDMAPFRLA